MKHYCYVTTNIVNNKQYVGVSKVKTKPYYGSGRLIRNAIQKYGTNNFKVEILEWFDDRELALDKEVFYINELNTIVPNGYNIINKRIHDSFGASTSVETRQKISNLHTGSKRSSETCKNISIAKTGYKHTKEAREKMSKSHTGLKVTKETREKISAGNKGRYISKETREKISAGNKGRTISEETRKKLSDAKKGKKLTMEHKKNISGRIPWNKGMKMNKEFCEKTLKGILEKRNNKLNKNKL